VIVLVSEGLLASDRPGGRPDIEDMGRVIGETPRDPTAPSTYCTWIVSA
jgi:hypothetical protein